MLLECILVADSCQFRIVEGKTLEEVLATPKDQLIEEWAGPKMMDHFFPGAGKQYVTGSQAVL